MTVNSRPGKQGEPAGFQPARDTASRANEFAERVEKAR